MLRDVADAQPPPTTSDLTSGDILDAYEEIVSSAHVLTAVFNARFATIESSGLAPLALRTIDAAGRRGLSQVDLARALNQSAPKTTRLVDFLEHSGLVLRSPHPSDRRINMIHLSDAGDATLKRITDTALQLGRRLLERNDGTSLKDFRSQLSQIVLVSKETLPL